jgi:hypothetical protein
LLEASARLESGEACAENCHIVGNALLAVHQALDANDLARQMDIAVHH